MFQSESKYDINVAILREYKPYLHKLTLCRAIRKKGFETEIVPKGSVNDDKLDNNISRARAKIFEYASCNEWQWFSTFTLDSKKYNRNDLEKFRKDFSLFIRRYNKKSGLQVKYLVIPETHKDGAWHMHGLLMGLPDEHIRLFTLQEKLPTYIREKLSEGQQVYDWGAYRDKFGYTNLEPIRNLEACSKYVTKYISKSIATDIKATGAHLYYNSQGLKTSKVIAKGQLNCELNCPDYENDWVKVKWIKDLDENKIILENLVIPY